MISVGASPNMRRRAWIAAGATTEVQSARFMQQAGLSSTPSDIAAVSTLTIPAWIEGQFAMARAPTFAQWLTTDGTQFYSNYSAFEKMIWERFLNTTEHLRYRVGNALINQVVVGIDGLYPVWQTKAMSTFMDILWDEAFGNYKNLLLRVSRNPAMGHWLTFLGKQKASANAQPDENYARELMQLFSIGLYQLNLDGTRILDGGGQPIPSYTLADVQGLARVFTGYIYDGDNSPATGVGFTVPMINDPAKYETGTKTFLGQTLPAGQTFDVALAAAIDVIFNQQSIAPYVCKQLIQRLVTSNPSAAYVGRVSAKFVNNGSGVRGDMKAVIRAILLDTEARDDATALASDTFGRMTEPFMRYIQMSRTLTFTSPSGLYLPIALDFLGQMVGHSRTVFNHFGFAYTPPASDLSAAGLVSPESQLINESSLTGWTNMNQVAKRDATADWAMNFTFLATLEPNTTTLVNWLNRHFAADRIPAADIALAITAVDSIPAGAGLVNKRIRTAADLIQAHPSYLEVK